MRTLKAGSTSIIGFITEAPSVSRSTSNIPVTNRIKHRENFNKVRICKHLKVSKCFQVKWLYLEAVIDHLIPLVDFTFLWMLLKQHPLCHRMCKVTKESSGANKIMRNAIDSTSITLWWTSSSSRQFVFSTTSDGFQRGGVFICWKLGQNLSEMDVRTFARIKKVIWDQLLATKAGIIQS